jgi:hypothetical protein
MEESKKKGKMKRLFGAMLLVPILSRVLCRILSHKLTLISMGWGYIRFSLWNLVISPDFRALIIGFNIILLCPLVYTVLSKNLYPVIKP